VQPLSEDLSSADRGRAATGEYPANCAIGNAGSEQVDREEVVGEAQATGHCTYPGRADRGPAGSAINSGDVRPLGDE
jgi:hypothetical protein